MERQADLQVALGSSDNARAVEAAAVCFEERYRGQDQEGRRNVVPGIHKSRLVDGEVPASVPQTVVRTEIVDAFEARFVGHDA